MIFCLPKKGIENSVDILTGKKDATDRPVHTINKSYDKAEKTGILIEEVDKLNKLNEELNAGISKKNLMID